MNTIWFCKGKVPPIGASAKEADIVKNPHVVTDDVNRLARLNGATNPRNNRFIWQNTNNRDVLSI
jgi:hypothetical protein